jgi:uncharacterized protein (DUF433 family)
MKRFDRFTWDPNVMNGQPCIWGMRLIRTGNTLFRNYPELESEDLRQALAFAAANLDDVGLETPAA